MLESGDSRLLRRQGDGRLGRSRQSAHRPTSARPCARRIRSSGRGPPCPPSPACRSPRQGSRGVFPDDAVLHPADLAEAVRRRMPIHHRGQPREAVRPLRLLDPRPVVREDLVLVPLGPIVLALVGEDRPHAGDGDTALSRVPAGRRASGSTTSRTSDRMPRPSRTWPSVRVSCRRTRRSGPAPARLAAWPRAPRRRPRSRLSRRICGSEIGL